MTDTNADRTRPHSSALHGSDPGDTAFGNGWRELLFPVGAFRIFTTANRIHKVENVLVSTLLSQRESCELRLYTKVFVLLADEFVVHVDAAFEDDELCGLRLHTNLRTGPWYGQRGTALIELHADPGACIKALRGTYHDTTACQLGVIFSPLQWEATIAHEQIDPAVTFTEPIGRFLHRRQELVVRDVVCRSELRAVVIVVGSHGPIPSIDVVSSAQFETLHAVDRAVAPVENEHWLVLTDKERIVAVEVALGDYGVDGLRFTTTLRTSLWFGTAPRA